MGVYASAFIPHQLNTTNLITCRKQKPTDSDLEDDDEDDSDEDPAGWFEDEEDDGIKGQPIVEPDIGELQSIIRIDESRALGYSTFYEPRD